MTHLLAHTLSETVKPWITVSVRGVSIARGDTFTLSTPAAKLKGEIERIEP